MKLMRADRLDATIGAAFFSALVTFGITTDIYRNKADQSDKTWNSLVESTIMDYQKEFYANYSCRQEMAKLKPASKSR